MANLVFNSFKGRLLGDDSIVSSGINLKTDTIKISLHGSGYTPDVDADEFFDDVDNEVSASGSYVAGGSTLSITVSTDDVDDEGVVDATDVSWTSATISARYGIVRKDTGVASTSPLCWVFDFGSVQSSSAGTFAVVFASEGIFNLN